MSFRLGKSFQQTKRIFPHIGADIKENEGLCLGQMRKKEILPILLHPCVIQVFRPGKRPPCELSDESSNKAFCEHH